ncbi:hypothetical protein ABT304_00250 [Nocardioides sp. NPDC000445]|uniref:hypothetical protein n=1 Tax=Nocardioides sp. NPDC000445 TaxID=3154257 RepID=UPI0033230684
MKRLGITAGIVALAIPATACGGGSGDSDTDGTLAGGGDDLSAADATAYEECFDATCEVLVEKGTEIELDPDLGWEGTPGLGTSGWQRLTVTDLSADGVGLTLSAADTSSTGGMATILPVGDGKAYYLKGMTAKVLGAAEGQAVLSLSWSEG